MSDAGRSHDEQGSPAADATPASAPKERPRGPSWRFFLLALVIIGVVWLTSHRSRPSAVEWVEELDVALERAAETDRLILIAFHQPGCVSCRWMDREVFAKNDVAAALEDWVPVRVDASRRPGVTAGFGVEAYPSFAVLSPSGDLFRAFGGPLDAPTFILTIDDIRVAWEIDRQ